MPGLDAAVEGRNGSSTKTPCFFFLVCAWGYAAAAAVAAAAASAAAVLDGRIKSSMFLVCDVPRV